MDNERYTKQGSPMGFFVFDKKYGKDTGIIFATPPDQGMVVRRHGILFPTLGDAIAAYEKEAG